MMEYTNDGCLNLVIQTYYQDSSLSKDKNNKNYYLNWLENDMLFVINNYNSYEALSLKVIRSCPDIVESIVTNKSTVNILNHVKYLWDIMDDFQKQRMLRGYLIANGQ